MPFDNISSPYWNLMRSSAALALEDTLAIKGHIRYQETELALVLAETSQLQEKLRQLGKKQAQIQHHIRCYKSLLAPIRHLPPEILSQVFMHCMADTSWWFGPSIHDAPLVLLRVCAGWRDIALKTPLLWTNLTINGNIHPNLLSAWLARSGTCLLDLTVDDGGEIACFPSQAMVSSDVVALCRRLRSLTVGIRGYHSHLQHSPIFSIDPVDVPFLERLHVYTPYICDRQLSNGLLRFRLAPLIHHCHIDNWEELSLPWSQLTSLSLRNQNWVLPILRQCTNLTSLKLHYCSLNPDVDVDDPNTSFRTVFLRHLTKLDIRQIYPASGVASLDMPSLRDLTIKITVDEFRPNPGDVESLLFSSQQCGTQIEKFELLNACCLSQEVVEKCLTFMPQLKHLHLADYGIFRILSRGAETERLLPTLRSINTGHPQQSVDDVVDFIKARWNPYDADSESIQEIRATPACSELRAEQLSFLRQCLDEGLSLRCDDGRDTNVWPVRSGDEERGMKDYGLRYPPAESLESTDAEDW